MAITLPRASLGSQGAGIPRRARGRLKLPDAGDVPKQEVVRDPGLTVPDFAQFAGRGLEDVGAAIGDVGDVLRREADRLQIQHDATSTTEGETAFDGKTTAELRRRATEDDPSRPDFLIDFEKFIGLGDKGGGLIGEIISGLKGVSPGAMEALRLELLKRGRRIANGAGGLALAARQRSADDSVEAAINVTVGQVERDPDALPGILQETDRIIAKFAGTMTPDAERDQRTIARQANIEAAARGFNAAGRFPDATALLDGRFDQDLSPSARARIRAGIERAKAEEDVLVRRAVADAVAVLDRGRVPANLADVQAIAQGTSSEAPLAEAVEDRAEVVAFLRKPLADQAATLQARPEVTTRRALATEGRMQRAHMALRQQIEAGNGLNAAAELGVIGDVGPRPGRAYPRRRSFSSSKRPCGRSRRRHPLAQAPS